MDGPEVIDDGEIEEENQEMPSNIENVITLDDIMKGGEEDESDYVDIDTERKTEEDDDQYLKQFVEGIRKKEQLDQIEREKNQVNFEEDDDQFIIGL